MQTVYRWHTHEPVAPSTTWKDLLSVHHRDAPWDHITIVQSNSALSLIARSPQASNWMQAHLGTLSRTVMLRLDRVVTMEQLDRLPNLRSDDKFSWGYTAQKVVVAKSGEPWEGLRDDRLQDENRIKLQASFGRQLNLALISFGLRAPDRRHAPLEVVIVDDGKPMPIAVQLPDANKPGGQRRPQWVMSRVAMRLSSPHYIEGEFSVGHLTGLGFGRIFRDGYLQKAVASDMENI